MRKYCLYFEMAKLKIKNWKKRRNQSLVGLTPAQHNIFLQRYYFRNIHNIRKCLAQLKTVKNR
jgi:hypothetical protein